MFSNPQHKFSLDLATNDEHLSTPAPSWLQACFRIGIADGLSCGYGRAGTQNDRLAEAVILGTGTPIPGNRHAIGDADIEVQI